MSWQRVGYKNHTASALSLGALVLQPQYEKSYYMQETTGRGEERGPEEAQQLQSQRSAATAGTPRQSCQPSLLMPTAMRDTNYCYRLSHYALGRFLHNR